MTTRLTQTEGGGAFLPLTPEMTAHLDLTDTIEVTLEQGQIVLRKPAAVQSEATSVLTFEEAAARSNGKFAAAYKELAE